jgi:hypothetical protein
MQLKTPPFPHHLFQKDFIPTMMGTHAFSYKYSDTITGNIQSGVRERTHTMTQAGYLQQLQQPWGNEKNAN